MKEKLLARLEEMNKALDETHKRLQQASADLNLLSGHRAELVNVINMLEEPKEPEALIKEGEVLLADESVAA